jgi:hypothetical protein
MEVDWSHITKKRKNVTKQALDWNPQGQRRRGRPKNTWRRGLNTELQKIRMLKLPVNRHVCNIK